MSIKAEEAVVVKQDESFEEEEESQEGQDDEQEETSEADESSESEGEESNESEEEEESDEFAVTIGEESPPHEEAPNWVKQLRKSNKEIQKENRELKERLNAQEKTEIKPVELGKKPTIEDFDYDPDEFATAYDAWIIKKIDYDKQQNDIKAESEKQQESWNNTLKSYGDAKEALPVNDFDDAESVVAETLSEPQQAMILQGADNPAQLIYALGKNPKKASELSSIADPVKFAFAVAKLETKLKVNNTKKPPKPEKKVTGSSSIEGSSETILERLRDEANKTGDFTKVLAYKRKQKAK